VLSCPLNEQKYVGGFRPLIGTWEIVNSTGDVNSTGMATFMANGTFHLVSPTLMTIMQMVIGQTL